MRNPHRVIFDGSRGWALQSALKILARVRDYFPVEFHVHLRPTPPENGQDPQLLYALRKMQREITAGLQEEWVVVHGDPAKDEDYAQAGLWLYPTFIPEAHAGEAAEMAQRNGAIPVYNPVGDLRAVTAGVAVFGIPALDPLVRCRYAYEIIGLLANPKQQEQLRNSVECEVAA